MVARPKFNGRSVWWGSRYVGCCVGRSRQAVRIRNARLVIMSVGRSVVRLIDPVKRGSKTGVVVTSIIRSVSWDGTIIGRFLCRSVDRPLSRGTFF